MGSNNSYLKKIDGYIWNNMLLFQGVSEDRKALGALNNIKSEARNGEKTICIRRIMIYIQHYLNYFSICLFEHIQLPIHEGSHNKHLMKITWFAGVPYKINI